MESKTFIKSIKPLRELVTASMIARFLDTSEMTINRYMSETYRGSDQMRSKIYNTAKLLYNKKLKQLNQVQV